jgi:hypothetical protein
LFYAKNKADLLAYTLSGLTDREIKLLTGFQQANTNSEANAYEEDRGEYVRSIAPSLGGKPYARPDPFFAKHPDAEVDFLQGRQQRAIDALQDKYPDIKPGHGFFERLLDTHKEASADPLATELTHNHGRMLNLPEVPVRAALRFGEDMTLRFSHDNALEAAESLGLDQGMVDEEGFFTSHGRFVTRKEAAKLVGQTGMLFSEYTLQRIRRCEPMLYQNKSEFKLNLSKAES